MGLMLDASVIIPGHLLDEKHEIVCESCGYKRDCGLMGTTAHHLQELHEKKCPYGGDITCVESAIEKPPERTQTRRKIKGRGPGRKHQDTLHL